MHNMQNNLLIGKCPYVQSSMIAQIDCSYHKAIIIEPVVRL